MKLSTLLFFEAQNYENMFAKILANQPIETQQKINKEIKWAKQHLKKNSRIIWYLRLYRYALSITTGMSKEQALSEFNRTSRSDLTADDVKNINGIGPITRNLKTPLEHFMSMPVELIQNYTFDKQSPIKILNDFEEYENEYVGSQVDITTVEGLYENDRLIRRNKDDDIIISFPDGFAWVDLNVPKSDDEAKAMGHCGNRPSWKPGETILSLRKKISYDGKLWWHPVCTFILDKDGLLGEMKGYDNKKPADEYHDYIIKLLKDDRVQGIKGGGYRPEENFSLDDLSFSEKQELVALKPELGGITELYRKEGMTKRVYSLVMESLKSRKLQNITYRPEHKDFVVYTWNYFTKFLRECDDKDVIKIYEIAQGEADWNPTTDAGIANSFRELLDSLNTYHKDKFIQRAKAKNITDAANILISKNDELYKIYVDLLIENDSIKDQAWERLAEYAKVGWYFDCGGYLNIPINSDELKSFIERDETIKLIVSERIVVDIAAFDGDYDHAPEAINIGEVLDHGWNRITYDYSWRDVEEKRKEENLVDSDGDDTWLSGVQDIEDIEYITNRYLQMIQQGTRPMSRDPNQQKLLEKYQSHKLL
jgi:hypothetical protein